MSKVLRSDYATFRGVQLKGNPMENSLQKLNQRLDNQLFEELDELKEAVFDALASLEPTNIYNCLYPRG